MFFMQVSAMSIRRAILLRIRWATASAIFASLLAACADNDVSNGPKQGPASGPVDIDRSYPIDRHEGASAADGSPGASLLEGDHGKLAYTNGCLHMSRDGVQIGLVAPANATFDGQTFVYRNRPFRLGENVTFSGDMVTEEEAKTYSCKGALRVRIAP